MLMATNLAIDSEAVEDLMRLGGFSSKREAVDAAVREAIAARRQLAVRQLFGAIDFTTQRGAEQPAPDKRSMNQANDRRAQ